MAEVFFAWVVFAGVVFAWAYATTFRRPAVRIRALRSNGLDGKEIVRELKAVGGDLKALRLALTGAERGPELWTVIAALPEDEALRRVDAAL